MRKSVDNFSANNCMCSVLIFTYAKAIQWGMIMSRVKEHTDTPKKMGITLQDCPLWNR